MKTEKKKIGILTQPLRQNYGGALQNYALQTVLKREGFNPYTIYRHRFLSKTLIIGSFLKRWILKYIFRKNVIVRIHPTDKETGIIFHNIKRFIRENIVVTEKFDKKKFDITKKYDFNTYIVGSDQVWRPKYSPCLNNYFLDFLDGNNSVKKIVYAASFGVDEWEFSPEQTIKCSALAKQFNSISVREDSAVKLCKDYLDVSAIQVLDPSMLLKKEDYIDLIKRNNIPERENILFSFILDKSDEKNSLLQKVLQESNLRHISGMPPNLFHLKESKKDLSDCIYLTVEEWIAGFRDAKFVITDSFHGTVFSILFNKPFVVFANKGRGKTRFTSLLKIFNLEERIITSSDFDNKLFHLDYSEINKIVEKEREKSINYLFEALNS